MNKRINTAAVGKWLGMTAAALMLGACSQSEEAVEMLPEGKYPVELKATGIQPVESSMTRSTAEGNWDGITTVAVKIGEETKAYTVDNTGGNTAVVLKSADPFYWQSTADITVSAWPCASADNLTQPALDIKADQSADGYAASDAIEAIAQTVTYSDPKLEFKHRTAKVCVNVVNPDEQAMAADGVTLSFADGKNPAAITSNKQETGKYAALIAPAAQDANKFSVKIDIDGATYVYTHPEAYTFAANKQYTFTLTVTRNGIQLSNCTISGWDAEAEIKGDAKLPDYELVSGVWHIYTADGLKAWADEKKNNDWKKCSAVLEADIVMPAPAAGESNWEPVQSYEGIFDGNGKSISGIVIRGYAEDNCGFFAFIRGNNDEKGEVKNLTLKNVTIESTKNNVGAVAGDCRGRIYGCQVIGANITGKQDVGGVVGLYAPHGDDDIFACSADGTVSGYTSVGGLMGYAQCGSATGNWANCTVSVTETDADKAVGFLAGESSGSNFVFNSCAWAGTGADKPVGYSGSVIGYPALDATNVKVTADNWETSVAAMNTAIAATGYSWTPAAAGPTLVFPSNE